jgi:hypothetical protein
MTPSHGPSEPSASAKKALSTGRPHRAASTLGGHCASSQDKPGQARPGQGGGVRPPAGGACLTSDGRARAGSCVGSAPRDGAGQMLSRGRMVDLPASVWTTASRERACLAYGHGDGRSSQLVSRREDDIPSTPSRRRARDGATERGPTKPLN